MRLQNLVLTTNVAGIKILTCTNDDIMDNMKLYLRQGVSQYTVTGVKTGNMYKFTFPVLDFGIVRMQFVSTRGTQVRASTIFSTMIEDNVVSKPGIEYAKATDLTAVDDKYKIITDNLTGSLNLHKTNYNTFHDDQIIFNNNTTTDISNYKLTTNTSITNINTTLNGMYTKTEVNTLISNTNSSIDTKLQSYYNKTEVDNKLATLDLTNYAPKSTVYTKSETNALFTPYYTKTNVDDKFVLYYTKSNVDSLFANDRLSNDGRYVLKDDYDTYKSTIYTKTEVDTKVSNINTQITGLTNNINTLNTTVGDNYTTLDDKYVALNTNITSTNNTVTNISTANRNSTAIYGTYLEGIRGNINTNNYEMWFSTHNMTHASLTYTEVPRPSDPDSSLTNCVKISIPIPSWWKFDKLIDLKVECYDIELGVRIDGAFYTDTLTPILVGVSHPSSMTKIDILLTDTLVVYDIEYWMEARWQEGGLSILDDFTGGRVPKIKITGIGKPSGALTATYNGFTAI